MSQRHKITQEKKEMKEIQEINYNAKPAFYVMCMESLRKIAAKCGYALAVHGTCAHDFDLIAVRWAENYESPKYLATELVKEISHYSFYEDENTDIIELTNPIFRYKNQIHYAIPIYHNAFVDLTVIQDI